MSIRSKCVELECVENTDCSSGESCVNNKCEDVCRLDGVCGTNADCRTRNHVPLCSCREGFNGDPRIGCNRVIACARDVECPTNMMCAFGVCSREYFQQLVLVDCGQIFCDGDDKLFGHAS